MEDTYDGAEVRELLAAIRDALDLPAAATYEGLPLRDRLIASRAAVMAGALDAAVLARNLPDAAFIRRVAGGPLGYEPMPEGGAK